MQGGGGDDPSPSPAALPHVAVEWSMAPRDGLDRNSDGFVDYACNGPKGEAKFTSPSKRDGGTGCYEVAPAAFEVALSACGSGEWPGGASFIWKIGQVILEQDGCVATTSLPEGAHEVTASVVVDGDRVAGPTTHSVEVDDLLIVVLGDSWTVGTGAPDIAGDDAAYAKWLDAVEAWLAAQAALEQAEQDAADAADAAVDASIVFDDASAAADDALDACFAKKFGVRIVRVTNLGSCLSALGDIGVSLISDVTKLDKRIEESLDDAKRAHDLAVSAQRNAAKAAADASKAAATASKAQDLAGSESAGEYQHEGCDRSANAGPAQMAQRIEDADEHTL
jgi:hypothetical protein